VLFAAFFDRRKESGLPLFSTFLIGDQFY